MQCRGVGAVAMVTVYGSWLEPAKTDLHALDAPTRKVDVQIPDDALDLLSGSLGTRKEDPDENKPIVDVVKEKAKKEHIDRLGDRDDTIPPEYRHLLDGKDQGKPAKPEESKPKTSLSDDAAIDALSSGFSSCDTSTADKAQSSKKAKTEQSTSSTPVSKMEGKAPETTKAKTEQSTSSTPVSKMEGKAPETTKGKTEQSTSSTPVSKMEGKAPEATKAKTEQSTSSTPVSKMEGKAPEATKHSKDSKDQQKLGKQ